MCRCEGCSVPPPPAVPVIMPSHQLTQPMKPRLPRKLATSARINLNKYWHALEELMPVSRRIFDEADCNAINENIDNERRLAAMQLSDVQGSAPSAVPLNDVFQSGKKSSTSFPRVSSDSTSFPRVPPSFTRISVSPPIIAPDDPSGDENTPPTSTDCENAMR